MQSHCFFSFTQMSIKIKANKTQTHMKNMIIIMIIMKRKRSPFRTDFIKVKQHSGVTI